MQNNPQFVRTDKAITQALISLLKVKPFEKITVQDILDETPVTRSTFYKHFHDKYEIAEKMQQEFFEAQAHSKKHFMALQMDFLHPCSKSHSKIMKLWRPY